MKTTLEIPDDLFHQAKSTAALRGQSLKDLMSEALRAHLLIHFANENTVGQGGPYRVFGTVPKEVVAEIDAIIEEEFERVDLDDWQ